MNPSCVRAPSAKTIALAFASFVLLGIPGALFGVVWPAVRESFDLSQGAAGAFLALKFGGYFGASFFSGQIESALGARKSLMGATAAIAAGLAIVAAGPSWPALLAGSVVIGIGQGVLDGVVNIVAAGSFSQRWMNWLHASFGIGSAATPVLAQTAMSGFGSWRAAYLIAAALAGLLSVTVLQTRVDMSLPDTVAKGATRPPLTSTLSMPILWFGVVVFIAVAGLELSAGQWTYSLLTESRGIAPAPASALVTLYWAAFTLGRIVAGWFLTGAYSRASEIVLRLCSSGVAIGSLAIAWPATTIAGTALFGFCLGPLFALLVSEAYSRFGPNHAPNAIGVFVAASSVGLALMPALGGLLANRSLELVPGFLFAQALALIAFREAASYGRMPSMLSRIR